MAKSLPDDVTLRSGARLNRETAEGNDDVRIFTAKNPQVRWPDGDIGLRPCRHQASNNRMARLHHVNRPDRSTIRLNRFPSTMTYSITRIRSHVRTVRSSTFVAASSIKPANRLRTRGSRYGRPTPMVATTIRDTPIRVYHSIRTFSALATHSRDRRDTIVSGASNPHLIRTTRNGYGRRTFILRSFPKTVHHG